MFGRLINKFRHRPRYKQDGNIYLKSYNAIYIYIPKVACSSIKDALSLELNTEAGEELYVSPYVHQRNYPSVKKDEVLTKYSGSLRFAFVRNPWDRLYSCYVNKIERFQPISNINDIPTKKFINNTKGVSIDSNFEEFAKAVCDISDDESDTHFISQYTFLVDSSGRFMPNYIGKFETLSQDYLEIATRLNFTNKKLPHHLKSGKKSSYRNFYTDELVELVRKRYEKDIDLFGYTF